MNQEPDNLKKLRAFFDEEYAALKSYVGSRIKDSIYQDAEDIIQDVALKLFSGANGYSPINNVAGFVYRSVKNRIIDGLRKQKKNGFNEELEESKLYELAEILYGNADNTYPEYLVEELKASIANLKPVYQEVILAVDFEGYTYAELSEELNVSIGTLMSRRHRAMGILTKEINKKHKKL